MCAGMCAGQLEAPRSADRTGGAVFIEAVHRVCVFVCVCVHQDSVPGVSCPKTASPQTLPYAQGRDPNVRPRARQSSALPAATVAPVRIGKKEQTPSNGDHETSPDTPRTPAGAGSSPPAPGRAERAEGSREGEETQPREHVKSLRRGRWKITLAPSRPVLLCAARRAIFLRS